MRAISKSRATLEAKYREITGHSSNEGYVEDYIINNMYERFIGYGRSVWLGAYYWLDRDHGLSPEVEAEYKALYGRFQELTAMLEGTVKEMNKLRVEGVEFFQRQGIDRKDIHKDFIVINDFEKYQELETQITTLKQQLKETPKNKSTLAQRETLTQQITDLETQLRQVK
jgi:hypothetical protein